MPDLADLRDSTPGLYLDYRTEMIGTQVTDTQGVERGDHRPARSTSPRYDAFIERHLGASPGHASQRFVERFLEGPVMITAAANRPDG